METPVTNQRYLDFLGFSLTTVERACVQNLTAPLSIDEVRQQFPDMPAIIRIVCGHALIWAGSGKIVVADFQSLIGTRTVNLFFGCAPGRETLVGIKRLLGTIEAHIYGTTVPA